jgi:hypothetical protein
MAGWERFCESRRFRSRLERKRSTPRRSPCFGIGSNHALDRLSLDLSASDLSRHGACRHLTGLDLCVARGLRSAPRYKDPALEVLARRGLEHELRFVATLKAQGLRIVDLSDLGAGFPTEGSLAAWASGKRSSCGRFECRRQRSSKSARRMSR